MMELEKISRITDENVGSCVPCLECSICLEAASEPVVTLCGHLYCWPCMFRWLSSSHHGSRRCPVCKAAVSEDRLVPLYGCDRPAMDAKLGGGAQIPSRPPVPNVEHQQRHLLQDHDGDGNGDVHPTTMYGGVDGVDYYGGWAPVIHSSSECLLGGIALGVLLPCVSTRRGERLLTAPQPLHPYGGDWRMSRRQRREASRLQQIWVFIVVVSLLCFLFM